MKKQKKKFIRTPLLGFGGDGKKDEKPREKLTIELVGQGKSQAAQYVDLLKHVGLKRMYELCKEHQLFAVKKDNQYLVDTECKTNESINKKESEDGVYYYIYVNTSTEKKKEVLKQISKTLRNDDAPSPHPLPPFPPRELIVSFPDGTTIKEKYAKHTFAKAIEHIGAAKVAEVGVMISGEPLVTNDRSLYKKHTGDIIEIKSGWFVFTHMSNKDKTKKLKSIATQLGIEIMFG